MTALVIILICLFFGILWCVYHYRRSPIHKRPATNWGHSGVNRLDKINRWYCHHFHGLDAGPLPLPDSSGVVLVANHVSGLDPMLLIAASTRPIRFLIAREQYERPGLNRLFKALGCIPVDRKLRPQQAFYAARSALQAGEVVGVFPEGGIVTDKNPVKKLKKGAVLLADMAQAPIVAVRVDGVRGRGLTLPALFYPSDVTLFFGDTLPYLDHPCEDGQTSGRSQRHTAITRAIRPDLN